MITDCILIEFSEKMKKTIYIPKEKKSIFSHIFLFTSVFLNLK